MLETAAIAVSMSVLPISIVSWMRAQSRVHRSTGSSCHYMKTRKEHIELAEKILVVIPSLRRGGAERTVALITREWAGDHDVTIAVFNARDQAFPAAESARTVDRQCPASRPDIGKVGKAITRIRRLASLIRSEAPDRIISFMESANFPSVFACLAARRLPDLTISVRNNPLMFPTYYRLLIPFLYRWPGRIVTGSQGVRRALIDEFHVPAHKCFAIPNPIDADAIQKAAALPTSGRPKLASTSKHARPLSNGKTSSSLSNIKTR